MSDFTGVFEKKYFSQIPPSFLQKMYLRKLIVRFANFIILSEMSNFDIIRTLKTKF